ncbi:MAG: phosphoglycerate dehydrogenase [Candidatus Methanoplasma sp.]|jgi:D-3-phosphoglycerate dehydrogenase|nr:phosphoglycerate dehydrogenase [Candidatus Methanoplasma sp.]
MTTRILVSDSLDEEGLNILKGSGFPVDERTDLTEDQLCGIIGDYDCLIIRSGTKVTRKVIDAGKRLKVIGRAGVGVDNVDIPYATERGILIMNTPAANIISAAEHSCAMLLTLARNIPFAHDSVHRGEWKRSKYTGVELNGKVLGIVGVGRVGGEVAKRMKAFNMTLIGYDPFLPKDVADEIGVRLTTFEEVISTADFMTIHTPLLPETVNMISLPQFRMMKPNVRIANVARGGIVNEDDLYTALKEKVIAGAAFDVWCNEPLSGNEIKLLELDNLVTTPHLGASTVEAQERVAIEVATAAVKYLKDGEITNAINAPRGRMDPETETYMPLAERMGVLAHQIAGNNPIEELDITYCGELAGRQTKMLTVSAVIGILKNIIGKDNANIINALPVAKQKGISIKESFTEKSADYANMIELGIVSKGKNFVIRGTVFGDQPRLVGYGKYTFDAPMSGDIVMVSYRDSPGIIGAVGSVFGTNNINIAQMSVGRSGSDALMVITVDQNVPSDVLGKIAKAAGTDDVKFADLVDN